MATVFAAARSGTSRIVAGELTRVPEGVVHAKTMGTTTTLCGVPTMTWAKFWDLAFLDTAGERCPACSARVQAKLALT